MGNPRKRVTRFLCLLAEMPNRHDQQQNTDHGEDGRNQHSRLQTDLLGGDSQRLTQL